MKIVAIDHSPPAAPTAAPTLRERAAPAGERPPAAGAPREASAQVALSPAASVLVGAHDSEFDGRKVARIAQAIRDGDFKIDAEAIADALIADAQSWLGDHSH